MKANHDPKLWQKTWLDLPFGTPTNPASPTDAMKTAGCYVVSHELTPTHWPRLWGRVARFDQAKDEVVVISDDEHHRAGNPPTVWTGTVSEFFSMWHCD